MKAKQVIDWALTGLTHELQVDRKTVQVWFVNLIAPKIPDYVVVPVLLWYLSVVNLVPVSSLSSDIVRKYYLREKTVSDKRLYESEATD